MEALAILSGLVSLFAVIVFFVTCNTIATIKDHQKALGDFLVEQAKKQNKHNEYVEKIMFDIKELLKK